MAIINMARALNLRVTAEGVTTPAQIAFLQEEGCDILQGEFYGMPMPVEELTARSGPTSDDPVGT